jgi:hypothetical protein
MPSVHFNYGNWQFWSVYSPPLQLGNQKVTFDGINKIIIVNEGVTELDFREDVYSAWKEWLLDPNQTNIGYEEAISAIGGDPLPGNRQLGTTYFLENGWRMRTWEGDHELTVTGNVFTRTGVSLFVPTLNPWTITINLNTATLVETILPSLSLGEADIDGIATATWAEVLSGTSAGDRLIALAAALANVDQDVWNYIIDSGKSQSAGDKLKAIATKTQDIALS